MIIKYTPKITSANTTYVRIKPDDMETVKNEMIRYLAVIGEMDRLRQTEADQVRQSMHTIINELPKSKSGPNTYASFIGGVINNTMFGEQRDLTLKQIDGIELVSKAMSQLFDHIPRIEFME